MAREEADTDVPGCHRRPRPCRRTPSWLFDIGGGSTEFAPYGIDDERRPPSATDMGCVRMTEAWLHHDPPHRRGAKASTLSIVELHLDDVQREIPDAVDARTFVGLAGDRERHGCGRDRPARPTTVIGSTTSSLTRDAAEDVFRTLATEAAR